MQYHRTCNKGTDLILDRGLSFLSRKIGHGYDHFLVNLDISTARIEQLRIAYRHIDQVILYALVEWRRRMDLQKLSSIQQVHYILRALENIEFNHLVLELVRDYNIKDYDVNTNTTGHQDIEELSRHSHNTDQDKEEHSRHSYNTDQDKEEHSRHSHNTDQDKEEHSRHSHNTDQDNNGEMTRMAQLKINEIPHERTVPKEFCIDSTGDVNITIRTQSSGIGSIGSCSGLSTMVLKYHGSMHTHSSGIGSLGSNEIPNPYCDSTREDVSLKNECKKPLRRPSLLDYCYTDINRSEVETCDTPTSLLKEELNGRGSTESHGSNDRKLPTASSCSSRRPDYQSSEEDLTKRSKQNKKITSKHPSLFAYNFDSVTEEKSQSEVVNQQEMYPSQTTGDFNRACAQPNDLEYIGLTHETLSTTSSTCSSSTRSESPSSDDNLLASKTRHTQSKNYGLKQKSGPAKTPSLLNKIVTFFKGS